MSRPSREAVRLALLAGLAATPALAHDFTVTVDVPEDTYLTVASELQLAPRWGAQGEMMLGRIAAGGYPAGVFLLGVQSNYYFLGGFDHGLALCGALDYVGVSTDAGDAHASGTALLVSAMLGYKYAAPFGLTVELQGGAIAMAVRAVDNEAESAYEAVFPSRIDPVIHLRLGWSF